MDAAFGQIYARLYHEHWWFRVREAMLLREIGRLDLPSEAAIMDVGCGDAVFFPKLSQFGQVSGIEVDDDLIRDDNPHRDRIHTQPLGDPCYEGMRFDLITALDVIEHIADDTHAVASMAAMLNPGGVMLITVPAFDVLWDEHDVLNHHYRRYTRESLRRLVQPYGEIVKLRYCFGGLFLPKLAVKWINRFRGQKLSQHRLPPPWLNRAMRLAFGLESRLPWLPFGTSVMAVVRKPFTLAEAPQPLLPLTDDAPPIRRAA